MYVWQDKNLFICYGITNILENQAFHPTAAKGNSQLIILQIQRATWKEVNVVRLKWTTLNAPDDLWEGCHAIFMNVNLI